MEIELAAVEDAEAVAELWVDLASEQRQYDSHVRPAANEGVIRDELTRHAVTDRLLVARDGEIVGFVMFTVDRGSYEMDVTQGVVENLFVVPGRRNDGIGSDLLAAAERQLGTLGVDTVVLEAMADNLDARRFYRRHGYDSYRVKLEKPLESDNHSKEDR
jgi:ribosomal protein S18 acetylase RimI-like enzyme